MLKKYHIRKDDQEWHGTLEGSKRATVIGKLKKDVTSKIFKAAKNYGNAEVYIYNSKGKLSSKKNFLK
ncbi:DUF2188 domain-containing protein [Gramella sp. BOM4]|nr:DUF2188 domain-containing protein [Christiangramia bathymodioli]